MKVRLAAVVALIFCTNLVHGMRAGGRSRPVTLSLEEEIKAKMIMYDLQLREIRRDFNNIKKDDNKDTCTWQNHENLDSLENDASVLAEQIRQLALPEDPNCPLIEKGENLEKDIFLFNASRLDSERRPTCTLEMLENKFDEIMSNQKYFRGQELEENGYIMYPTQSAICGMLGEINVNLEAMVRQWYNYYESDAAGARLLQKKIRVTGTGIYMYDIVPVSCPVTTTLKYGVEAAAARRQPAASDSNQSTSELWFGGNYNPCNWEWRRRRRRLSEPGTSIMSWSRQVRAYDR